MKVIRIIDGNSNPSTNEDEQASKNEQKVIPVRGVNRESVKIALENYKKHGRTHNPPKGSR